MKNIIAIAILFLALSARALYVVDVTTLSTQNVTNTGFLTITNNGVTNSFYLSHVTNRNYGDSPLVAFNKVNSNFVSLASLVASNLSGQTNLTLNGVVGGLSGNNLFTTAGTNAILSMLGGGSWTNGLGHFITMTNGTGNDLTITNSFTLISTNQTVVTQIYDSTSNLTFSAVGNQNLYFVPQNTNALIPYMTSSNAPYGLATCNFNTNVIYGYQAFQSTQIDTNYFPATSNLLYFNPGGFTNWPQTGTDPFVQYQFTNIQRIGSYRYYGIWDPGFTVSNYLTTSIDGTNWTTVCTNVYRTDTTSWVVGSFASVNAKYIRLQFHSYVYPAYAGAIEVYYPQSTWATYTNGNWSFYNATNVFFDPITGAPTIIGTSTNYANIYGTPYIPTPLTQTDSQGHTEIFSVSNSYGSPFGLNQKVVFGITNYNILTLNGVPITGGIGVTNVIGDITNGISGGTVHVLTNAFSNNGNNAGVITYGTALVPTGFYNSGYSGAGYSMTTSNALYLLNSSNIPINHAVSLWFKFNRYDVPDGSSMGFYGIGNNDKSGKGEDAIFNPPSTIDTYPMGGGAVLTSSNWANGTWHNMTAIRTNGVQATYIDGYQAKYGSDLGRALDQSAPFFIGRMDASVSYAQTFFNGQIDEVKVWDLTTYSNMPSPFGLFTNAAAYMPNLYYWSFNSSNLVDSISGAVLQVTNWNSYVTNTLPNVVAVGTNCVPYWVYKGITTIYSTNYITNSTIGNLASNHISGLHFDVNLYDWVTGATNYTELNDPHGSGIYAGGVSGNYLTFMGYGYGGFSVSNCPTMTNFSVSMWLKGIANASYSYTAWSSGNVSVTVPTSTSSGGSSFALLTCGAHSTNCSLSGTSWDWDNVVITSSNGILSLYVNGVIGGSITSSPSISSNMIINDYQSLFGTPYGYIIGPTYSMDEFNAWSRPVSASEIGLIYSNPPLISSYVFTNITQTNLFLTTTNITGVVLGASAFSDGFIPSINAISNRSVTIAGSGASTVANSSNTLTIFTPINLSAYNNDAGFSTNGGGTTYTNGPGVVGVIIGNSIGTNTTGLVATNDARIINAVTNTQPLNWPNGNPLTDADGNFWTMDGTGWIDTNGNMSMQYITGTTIFSNGDLQFDGNLTKFGGIHPITIWDGTNQVLRDAIGALPFSTNIATVTDLNASTTTATNFTKNYGSITKVVCGSGIVATNIGGTLYITNTSTGGAPSYRVFYTNVPLPSLSSSITIPHGFPITPCRVTCTLLMTNAILGVSSTFLLNQEVQLDRPASAGGFEITKDSTNVVISTGTGLNLIQRGGSSGTSIPITNSDWNVRIFAATNY